MGIDDYFLTDEDSNDKPFAFNFFGTDYSYLAFNTNGGIHLYNDNSHLFGKLTSSTPTVSNYAYCPYATSNALPDDRTNWNNNDYYTSPVLNSINIPFADYHYALTTGTAGFYVNFIGEYPHRMIVFSMSELPMFGDYSETNTTMAVLYEGTNIIDFYIKTKASYSSTNGSHSILGIQNANGSEACTITNPNYDPKNTGTSTSKSYNNTVWEAYNEAWRIKPADTIGYEIAWYKGDTTNLVSNYPSITVSPSMDEGAVWYYCRMKSYDMYATIYWDSVLVYPAENDDVPDTTLTNDTIDIEGVINIMSVKNQSVAQILKQSLLRSGVQLDTTQNATFNGKTIVKSNQIATFTNQDTVYPEIPIDKGILITTCNAAANPLGNGTSAVPVSDNEYVCQAMYFDYQNYLSENTWISKQGLKDIGYLDFWIIPDSSSIALDYSFGSQEYPNYVCSVFTDFFGIYIDGPYNEDMTLCQNQTYNNINISMVPGTSEAGNPGTGTRVLVNTVNAGTSNSNCLMYNVNKKYFIDNQNKVNTRTTFGGYTKRLSTDVVPVIPGKKYHIQIAIANVSDHALQSGLMLGALYGGPLTDTIPSGNDTTIVDNPDVNDYLLDVTICENELLAYAGLTGIAPLGLTFDTTVETQICNVTAKVHLQINPSYNTIITDSIEADGKYIFNGKELTEPGTYIDTLQSSYGCDSLVVLVLAPAGIGLEEISQQNGLYIYPNPAKSEVTVKCTDAKDGESINFIDIQGRVAKRIDANSISNGMTINIKDLESGFYYIRIGNKISKLIVK